jgi:predicted CXXCH cytochrome family protein
MQGNDFAQSVMYTHGISCQSCHDPHGTENNADLIKPANFMCLECHGPSSPNGPRAPSIEAHTHHKPGSPGNECVNCHMPKIAQTIADVNVRSHTFRFVMPSVTASLKVPNACNACHTDRSPQWASDALRTWTTVSPWRLGN